VKDLLRGLFSQLTRNGVVAAGVVTLLIKIASAVLSYAMFVLVANALSAGDYGRFGVGIALAITLANVATLGTPTSLLRYLPHFMASGQAALAKGYIILSLRYVLVFGLCISAIVATGAVFLPETMFLGSPSHYLAAALLVFVMTINDYLSGLTRGLGLVTLSQLPKDVVWRILVLAFAVISIWFSWPQSGASMLFAAALLLICTTIGQYMLARKPIGNAMQAEQALYDKRGWMTASLPIWGAGALIAVVQQFDVVILGLLGYTAESGQYFAALRTASLLSLLLLAGNLAAAPLMSAQYHAHDHASLAKTVRIVSAGVGVPSLLGLGFLALIGRWLLALFDPSFVSAYDVLLIIGAGYAFDAAAGPNAYLLQMTGHERAYLKTIALSYLLVVIAQLIFIPRYGLLGAAVPNALGMMFTASVCVYLNRKYLGIDPSIFGLLRRQVPQN
jgi:O-antigen/teichoic acid export membrane protein